MSALRVTRTAGLSTVQDAGRPGFMHMAVPPGGPLVRAWLARANACVDNAAGAAAIETFGSITLSSEGAISLGTDEGERIELAPRATWTLACGPARVRYVAVRGGIDVPMVLGGRGTLLAAGLGGLAGRALVVGDLLRVGNDPLEARVIIPLDLSAAVLLHPGPDLARLPPGTFEALLASRPRIDARSDRVGVRLVGAALPSRPLPENATSSTPMVRGAIQLPPDGNPIVLGPDHPTTGGYPVIAVAASEDVDRLFALPVGATVHFAGPSHVD